MNLMELGESTLWVRVLAATISLLGLFAAAGTMFVFAMMLILFSLDSGRTAPRLHVVHSVGWKVTVGALAVAVIVPPILLLLKCPTMYCLIPAGLGFAIAGISTLAVVIIQIQ